MYVLDIGEVAERSGVAPSTLRYYEEIGLIASLGRQGLRRQFDGDVLLKLSLIAMGKAAGFSLEEIAGMFGRDGKPDIPRDQLRERADALQRQMIELRTLRDVLRHVADCPAPSHLECPTFRKLMQAASHRKLAYRPTNGPRSGRKVASKP
ncbi:MULTISPECIES: helix-turn-helix domain-containing protein [unclassified Bosea (in: a-proteobacteria)]|uniref:helix-turn-helix domain-containing protein n=1 Tax=unclassified Bosea (in: a-proteobacteria) TaxID=2653178 RepID=UPI000F74E32A|nr:MULTISPECIES: helix-turn-helix domain-containing protein [unclassified Bosea (in: a-proteobacteria)]AZO77935.1 MerR family transcriptional regulator [Bosea sp. Tri-49]RXT19309.1 MerR family transcriptional regulator [Bosea sp. Tri-39]RXT41581.1 MerR family transcriptional regulator [Bosea sp. Tri-54]